MIFFWWFGRKGVYRGIIHNGWVFSFFLFTPLVCLFAFVALCAVFSFFFFSSLTTVDA